MKYKHLFFIIISRILFKKKKGNRTIINIDNFINTGLYKILFLDIIFKWNSHDFFFFFFKLKFYTHIIFSESLV